MEVITMTKKQLNQAIYTVVTSKFKKDAPVMFEIVENAGYSVYKSDGNWCVADPNTHKTVRYGSYGYFKTYDYDEIRRRGTRGVRLTDKIDFVAYLSTPCNTDWYEIERAGQWWYKYEGRATSQYKQLKIVKHNVSFYSSEIEKTLKKL